jgi:BirA family biotin operon repressor/biotin-[acetyl-CoA-carboxylase] ligase
VLLMFRVPQSITRIEHFATIDSTNDAARRIASESPGEVGLLVVADSQTAGRGRGSNRWWTGDGSIAFSLLFDPRQYAIDPRFSGMIPLSAALAVVDAVTERLPSPAVGIHWPNDVYIGPRKLAGVLVEGLPDGRRVLGLGCNVNNSVAAAPPEVAAIVASLVDELGAQLDRDDFLSDVLQRLDAALVCLGSEPTELATLADELCQQRGRVLNVQTGDETVTGVCAGIASDGALLLDTITGRRTIYSGVVLKPV